MINRFSNHYNKTITYDLLTKFNYTNSYRLPKIKKLTINLIDNSINIKKFKLIYYCFLIEFLTNQKPTTLKSKKNKIHLKIKQGMIIGVQVNIQSNKILHVLENLILFIFPTQSDFKLLKLNKNSTNIFVFTINQWISPLVISTNKYINTEISFSNLQIIIESNTKTLPELQNLLNSFTFPVKKML